ncbi:MAG: hypothetical protein ACK55D_04550 [Synechococcaceae cyanobacterium]
MYTSKWVLAFALAGAVAGGLAWPARAAEACRALKEQRDGLARQAIQAEFSLLHGLRQQLCPQQEALATGEQAPAPDPLKGPQLDYGAYIRCRQQAEAQLQRSRAVLYRNRRGFPFYTAAGARLARQADGLQPRLERQCGGGAHHHQGTHIAQPLVVE